MGVKIVLSREARVRTKRRKRRMVWAQLACARRGDDSVADDWGVVAGVVVDDGAAEDDDVIDGAGVLDMGLPRYCCEKTVYSRE